MASWYCSWNMSLNSSTILVIAGISGFIAVLMGAAAAHWLSASLAPEDLNRIEKAATYQMYHTLALLALAAIMTWNDKIKLSASCWLFTLGVILFCGSLYAYSFTHFRPLVYVTPLGGLSFMAGWLALAIQGVRCKDCR